MKSETSLGGSRIENLGKYFLDKHTGQVSLVTYHREILSDGMFSGRMFLKIGSMMSML